MNKTRLAVLAVAIGSAGLAIYMAKDLVGQKEIQTVEVNKVETVDVLVATKNLQMGERLVGGSIGWQSWPKSTVSSLMITSEAQPDAKTKYETARARAAIFAAGPAHRAVRRGGDRVAGHRFVRAARAHASAGPGGKADGDRAACRSHHRRAVHEPYSARMCP